MISAVQAGFEKRCVFNALKSHDVMCHSQVYAALGQILGMFPRPVRLLDVGCGDASDIKPLLAMNGVGAYVGVDSSNEAISLAEKVLAGLSTSIRLIHDDYQEALIEPPASYDIVWVGLFLHHLGQVQKKKFLNRALELLSTDGLVLAHDPMLAEHESREAYIARLEEHGRMHWAFLNPEQLAMARRHWTRHGRQERFSTLQELGLEAGFSKVSLLWSDPDRFYGLLCFQRAEGSGFSLHPQVPAPSVQL
jgi:cyclopropane fatty-acyl-phospholipid synthase-like methyltransferase